MKKTLLIATLLSTISFSVNAQGLSNQVKSINKEFKSDMKSAREGLKEDIDNAENKLEKKQSIQEFRQEKIQRIKERNAEIRDAKKDFMQDKHSDIKEKLHSRSKKVK